jgi:DNA-binding MarR family transcriptional regulator
MILYILCCGPEIYAWPLRLKKLQIATNFCTIAAEKTMDKVKDSKLFREKLRILNKKLGVLEDGGFFFCGVTFSQCHALIEIGRAQPISLCRLAEVLSLDNSTMSRTVNNLVESGLAVRDTDPSDRRCLTIRLTDAGQKLFEQAESVMDGYFEEIFGRIPEGKRKGVLEDLRLIIEAVDESGCCDNSQ